MRLKTKYYPKEPRKRRRVRGYELVLETGGSLYLPGVDYTSEAALECASILNEIERCSRVGDALAPRWEEALTARPDFKRRLVAKGLIDVAEGETLGELYRRYVDAKKRTLKDSTRRTDDCILKAFLAEVGAETRANEFDRRDAFEYVERLKSRLAEATWTKRLGVLKKLFNWGVENELVEENPFHKIRGGSQVNRDRIFYVDWNASARILDACPSQEQRTLFVFMRYAGARAESETRVLRWRDVDFERRRLTIRSPKTERYKGGDKRLYPLFPELEREFRALKSEREESIGAPVDGDDFVFRRGLTAANMRKPFLKTLERAGIEPWPRLFQNLRASCDKDVSNRVPPHVAGELLGHSPTVAARHYLKANEADFSRLLADGAFGEPDDDRDPDVLDAEFDVLDVA